MVTSICTWFMCMYTYKVGVPNAFNYPHLAYRDLFVVCPLYSSMLVCSTTLRGSRVGPGCQGQAALLHTTFLALAETATTAVLIAMSHHLRHRFYNHPSITPISATSSVLARHHLSWSRHRPASSPASLIELWHWSMGQRIPGQCRS